MSPDEQRTTCSACRGAGTVVSNLGGTAHQVTCPWCGGDGAFHTGRDAQAGPAAETGEVQSPDSGPSEPPDVVA